MRVTLSESGGHLAGLKPRSVTVDAGSLDEGEAAALRSLVERAAASAASGMTKSQAPDAISYRIAVEGGEHPTVIRQSDVEMTPAFASLVDWLKEKARG